MTDPMQGGQPNQFGGQNSGQNGGQYQNNYGQYGQYPGYQGRPPRMDPFSMIAEDLGFRTLRAIRIIMGVMGVIGVILGLALLLRPDKTLIAVGGIVIVRNTALSASALTLLVTIIVGISWIMEGVMSLAASWGLPHSGWAIFSGVVSIIAGIIVMIYPLSSVIFLVIFSGCALLVLGVVSIIRAFTFGRN